MASAKETFEQRLKTAMDAFKTVPDRETRESLQQQAMLDVIEWEIMEIDKKHQKLIDLRRQLEDFAFQLKTETGSESSVASDFEQENKKLQAIKATVHAELFQLKSQEHTRAGIRKGDTFMEKQGVWK